MKIKFDKIVALGGSALIGYYLGLSIFSGNTWRLLTWTLPPINNRHLPRFYTGIMGACVTIAIGYLIYTRFIEKTSFNEGRKQYALGVTALFLLPVITMTAFRIQSVSFVKNVESSDPTGFYLRFEEPSISFEISENTGTIFGKSVVRTKAMGNKPLGNMGQALRELEIIEVSEEQKNFTPDSQGTIWIDYTTNKGKWYSKILTWEGDKFQESSHQFILYKGTKFEKVLEDFNDRLSDLTSYTTGMVLNTNWVDDDRNEIQAMSQKDLQFLLDSLNEDNKITPNNNVVADFKEILKERKSITKKDTHLYVFRLKNLAEETDTIADGISLENVILYDDSLKIAYFEENYFNVDLSTILKKNLP